jgi:recombination protein RecR
VVVEDIADLWALEGAGVVNALYHVLGGHLSPLDGIGPDRLNIPRLIERAANPVVTEVLLALSATVEGQSTVHYLKDALTGIDVSVSEIAKGVPVGGELDYLDEGTLSAAIKARRQV